MWNPKCNGPNLEQAKKCKEDADAAELLVKFYQMTAASQRVFVAMFNAMEGEDDANRNAG